MEILRKGYRVVKPLQSLFVTLVPVTCYVCIGAKIFILFGLPLEKRQLSNIESNYVSHQTSIIIESSNISVAPVSYTKEVQIGNADDYEWDYGDAVVHSICLITAIGSCVSTPPTTVSQLFAIFYALIGLPLAILSVGNVGKFIGIGMAKLIAFVEGKFKRGGKSNRINTDEVDLNDKDILQITAKLVLGMFICYLLAGAAFIPEFREENYITAVFICFVSLTTVAVSQSHMSSIIVYLLFGMALTTLMLEVASNYLRKVHHMGRTLSEASAVVIHFGGKDLTVGELIWSFGREHQLDDNILLRFLAKMDEFVAETIQQKESGELRKPKQQQINCLTAQTLGFASREISFADGVETDAQTYA